MAQQEDPLLIVRGGIFGGELPHIEVSERPHFSHMLSSLRLGRLAVIVFLE